MSSLILLLRLSVWTDRFPSLLLHVLSQCFAQPFSQAGFLLETGAAPLLLQRYARTCCPHEVRRSSPRAISHCPYYSTCWAGNPLKSPTFAPPLEVPQCCSFQQTLPPRTIPLNLWAASSIILLTGGGGEPLGLQALKRGLLSTSFPQVRHHPRSLAIVLERLVLSLSMTMETC